jgi:hypothetical protein
MTEKMGFESNKRIVKVFNNQRVTAVFSDRTYHFRSKFEYNWALYLDFLKETHEIIEWRYEPEWFYFNGEKRGATKYLPDFRVIEKLGNIVWQECKGWHEGDTNTKLRRMAKHYPDTVFDLVLMKIPKKGKSANRRRVAEKYTRRIIDASVIFKQMKGILKFI